MLRVDAEKFETAELLAKAILARAVRALAGPVDQVAKTVRSFFGAVRPDVTYNLEDRSLSVAFNLRRERAVSGVPLVADVLDGVEALAKSRRKRVVVIIDEFQQLVTVGGLSAERQLRAVVQTHPHVSYVFPAPDPTLAS